MRRWTIRLSGPAERDFADILIWSRERFGAQQAKTYGRTLIAALTALEAGPDQPGIRRRDDISPNLRSLHVARRNRRGRHFILFRATETGQIQVVRILHDAMDLARHIPDPAED